MPRYDTYIPYVTLFGGPNQSNRSQAQRAPLHAQLCFILTCRPLAAEVPRGRREPGTAYVDYVVAQRDMARRNRVQLSLG